jgi:transposase-like protein
MAHANARLTQFGRLLLVQRITELGWPPAQAAQSLGVSRATAYKWLARYRAEGRAGLADRPSRPHRCPHALPASQVRRVLAARRRRRQGPHRLGYHLGMARSTVYGVLRRHNMSRLAHLDRPSGAVVRYQREHPGELVHLDVKKLGRIPDGGGHRVTAAPMGPGAGASAMTTSTRPSMIVPGSPSARSCPMRRPPPRPGSWSRRPGSSPSMA